LERYKLVNRWKERGSGVFRLHGSLSAGGGKIAGGNGEGGVGDQEKSFKNASVKE